MIINIYIYIYIYNYVSIDVDQIRLFVIEFRLFTF